MSVQKLRESTQEVREVRYEDLTPDEIDALPLTVRCTPPGLRKKQRDGTLPVAKLDKSYLLAHG